LLGSAQVTSSPPLQPSEDSVVLPNLRNAAG
jgi:hypothetical protein